MFWPWQRVWLVMSFTWPLGFTVTGTEIGVPGQEPMYGVMMYVTTPGLVPVLVSTSLMRLVAPGVS